MKKFYSLENIKKKNPQYAIILGERANGKSYAVKMEALQEAYSKKEVSFALVRRFEEDIKTDIIENYFGDMPVEKITKGEYTTISFFRSYFYFANIVEDKVVRGCKIGRVFALSNDERYKSSTVLPYCKIVIFEEFTTEKVYLRNEVSRLMNFISTIMRLEGGIVYMIANKISRVCPYFNEWGLRGIPTMDDKNGQIDEYKFKDSQGFEVKICVEMCPSFEQEKSGMFFGKIGKQIDGGEWKTTEHPHLLGELRDYDILYSMSLCHMDFKFNILLLIHNELDFMCVYVYPASLKIHERLLTEEYSTNYLQTPTLRNNLKIEKIIAELIRNNKMVFPNNLIAEDFENVIKNMKQYPFSLN